VSGFKLDLHLLGKMLLSYSGVLSHLIQMLLVSLSARQTQAKVEKFVSSNIMRMLLRGIKLVLISMVRPLEINRAILSPSMHSEM
jgi:hypothetical protein